jgi:hypothetical protein
MRYVNIAILAVFFLLGASCKKKIKNHPIPSVPVDITIDMTLPSYSDLNNVSGWCYVTGGIKGIIVYRLSSDLFVAWERLSPEDPENTCSTALTPTEDNFLQLKDSCSGALFSLIDGSPISGSEWGLRQYQTNWNGSNLLHIYN